VRLPFDSSLLALGVRSGQAIGAFLNSRLVGMAEAMPYPRSLHILLVRRQRSCLPPLRLRSGQALTSPRTLGYDGAPSVVVVRARRRFLARPRLRLRTARNDKG